MHLTVWFVWAIDSSLFFKLKKGIRETPKQIHRRGRLEPLPLGSLYSLANTENSEW